MKKNHYFIDRYKRLKSHNKEKTKIWTVDTLDFKNRVIG